MPLDIVRDDGELAAALAVTLDEAEAGDGTVAWADVRDRLDPVQWGRLLDGGLLVPAGDRFVVDDPTAAREPLAEMELGDTAGSERPADAASRRSPRWTTSRNG